MVAVFEARHESNETKFLVTDPHDVRITSGEQTTDNDYPQGSITGNVRAAPSPQFISPGTSETVIQIIEDSAAPIQSGAKQVEILSSNDSTGPPALLSSNSESIPEEMVQSQN